MLDGIDSLNAFQNILNGIVHRILAGFQSQALVSHILKGDDLPADFILGQLFPADMLVFVVVGTVGAAVDMNKDKIVLAGGVASNSRLREMLQAECKKHGIALYYPDPILCTDNAAMIGCAAYYKYKAGGISDLDLDAVPDLPL